MKTQLTLKLIAVSALLSAAYSASAEDFSLTSTEVKTVVGVGAAYVPEYTGAFKNRFLPAVIGEYQNADGIFVSTLRGIGIAKSFDDLAVSAGLGYRPGRYQNSGYSSIYNSDALQGMGNIPGTMTANLAVSKTFANQIKVTLDAQLAANHRDNGNTYRLGITAPVYKTGHDQVELGADVSYGDSKYNRTYFGVTPTQSANSGYATYTPSSGWDQAMVKATWTHSIDKNWSVRTVAGIQQTMGNASDSPLTVKKTNPVLMSTVNYAF